ncbi:Aldo-ket-red domain-containing protein [Mycena indigotica]|uniref:Aldo-ket-red domain-containing protein n=1 Tax=Mycena indigotica TaxID=2126181 RepID=A0A8H6RYJ3_9AGAR|nr:Aldo-ket-red domain-containing protein [Mycena indigotica]KAF7289288.1 Aldo-ket-red domain-containing protein [Mycena indigotica]
MKTVQLGGTASDVKVAQIAHGLMHMTWNPLPTPDEQCFEAIKAGIDALPEGTKMVLNSAEFYGAGMGTGNLEMLSRFFAKYPQYVDKTFLMVKGGFNPKTFGPDSSPDFLRNSVDICQRALGSQKKIDAYQPARVDSRFPIEDTMKVLVELKNQGKFGHIGLSECSAATMRKAHAVHPLVAVEIEISLFSYEEETGKVIAAANELGVAVLGYSPLGQGVLGGSLKSSADLPTGDLRHQLARYKEEELKHNLLIVEELTGFAKTKGITVGQLCIAWVGALSPRIIPLPGSSKATRTLENLAVSKIELSKEDIQKIDGIVAKHGVKGARGFGGPPEKSHLWG